MWKKVIEWLRPKLGHPFFKNILRAFGLGFITRLVMGKHFFCGFESAAIEFGRKTKGINATVKFNNGNSAVIRPGSNELFVNDAPVETSGFKEWDFSSVSDIVEAGLELHPSEFYKSLMFSQKEAICFACKKLTYCKLKERTVDCDPIPSAWTMIHVWNSVVKAVNEKFIKTGEIPDLTDRSEVSDNRIKKWFSGEEVFKTISLTSLRAKIVELTKEEVANAEEKEDGGITSSGDLGQASSTTKEDPEEEI